MAGKEKENQKNEGGKINFIDQYEMVVVKQAAAMIFNIALLEMVAVEDNPHGTPDEVQKYVTQYVALFHEAVADLIIQLSKDYQSHLEQMMNVQEGGHA